MATKSGFHLLCLVDQSGDRIERQCIKQPFDIELAVGYHRRNYQIAKRHVAAAFNQHAIPLSGAGSNTMAVVRDSNICLLQKHSFDGLFVRFGIGAGPF